MKLSTKGRYGLRALIDLAQYSEETPVSITSISKRQDISERYLEQLMSMLKKAGIVKSIRGANGGYILARDAKEISVGEVECAGLDPRGGCQASESCVTKYVWKRINDSINRTVNDIWLSQLVEEGRNTPCDDKDRSQCKN